MTERKIIFLILIVVLYSSYSVHMWFAKRPLEISKEDDKIPADVDIVAKDTTEDLNTNGTKVVKEKPKAKIVAPVYKNACSVLDVFLKRPPIKCKEMNPEVSHSENPTITVLGITIFLVVLSVNAVLDVLKVKEEERARIKENPDGYRRHSLAEFANKKPLRRDSSKFGLHLFQITESAGEVEDDEKSRRQSRPYTRGDSTNSYLSERKIQGDGMAPFSTASESPTGEPKVSKRHAVSKLIGGRPAPMVRRSSFPALPFNPDVHAMMMHGHHGHHGPFTDSDDETDGKGRRVRIIRRF